MYAYADGAMLSAVHNPLRHVQPSRVFAMGLTYEGHIREAGESRRGEVFSKDVRPDVGAQTIPLPTSVAVRSAITRLDPALSDTLAVRQTGPRAWPVLLDYEVEIGLVLLEPFDPAKAGATSMPRLGFFLANDVTARSIQVAGLDLPDRMRYWQAAKNLPGFLPVGDGVWCPGVPSPDLWPGVTLTTRFNGQLRQQASVDELIYTPRQILDLVAAHVGGPLAALDVILTGTPAGVGLQVPKWKRRLAALLPRHVAVGLAWQAAVKSPRLLKAGDVVQMDADWLGALTTVVQESQT